MKFLERFVRRERITFLTTQGFHKRAKMSFGPAAPFGMELYNEPVDIMIDESDINRLDALVAAKDVQGFSVNRYEVLTDQESLVKTLVYQQYQVEGSNGDMSKLIEKLENKEFTYTRGEKVKSLETALKHFVRVDDETVMLFLDTTTPNAYILDHISSDVVIKRVGYINDSKLKEYTC
jgi:uncharacterized protein (DUF2344 family)